MATKMMSPNTTLLWMDLTALTTPSAPKVADITAALASAVEGSMGRNLSKAVAAGYTLNPTDSDTSSSQSIVDEGAGSTRGAANYEGLIPFFREKDPTTNADSVYLAAYNMFKEKGRWGYWLRRVGKHYDSPFVVGDLVEVYKFRSRLPRTTVSGGSGGDIQFVVPFAKQGFLVTNVALVA